MNKQTTRRYNHMNIHLQHSKEKAFGISKATHTAEIGCAGGDTLFFGPKNDRQEPLSLASKVASVDSCPK
jgi:hypothetical protein